MLFLIGVKTYRFPSFSSHASCLARPGMATSTLVYLWTPICTSRLRTDILVIKSSHSKPGSTDRLLEDLRAIPKARSHRKDPLPVFRRAKTTPLAQHVPRQKTPAMPSAGVEYHAILLVIEMDESCAVRGSVLLVRRW
jgi:hypothetical protein